MFLQDPASVLQDTPVNTVRTPVPKSISVKTVYSSASVEQEDSAIKPLENVCVKEVLLELCVRSHVSSQTDVDVAHVKMKAFAKEQGCACVLLAGWVQSVPSDVHRASLVETVLVNVCAIMVATVIHRTGNASVMRATQEIGVTRSVQRVRTVRTVRACVTVLMEPGVITSTADVCANRALLAPAVTRGCVPMGFMAFTVNNAAYATHKTL